MNNREWFKQAKYGMMIHWGISSIPAGEWKGQITPFTAEWLQSYFRIPNSEYSQLAEIFNPIFFNADEWVKFAIDSGMQYMVVTSKHHDGFALYHSKTDKFNIVDSTPFKRDVIKELAEACQKYGLKFGLYYSQELDWQHPHGGGYHAGHTACDKMSWTNDWDFTNNFTKDYTFCFEEKIKPQLKEILTEYGDICLVWFDTPFSIRPEQSKELYDMVKMYQPNCLINSRIGNNFCDYQSMGDNEITEEYFTDSLAETAATINNSWGYKPFDQNWKSVDEILRIKNHLNERGVNYLLNVGPDYLGRIPAASQEILRAVRRKLEL